MSIRDPNLLELLHWSQQAARGEPCAVWLAWRKSSRLAARRAVALVDAVNRLDRGDGPMSATELGATDVAEFVEGQLLPAASEQFEAACWNSAAQLCEVVSAVQFAHDSVGHTKVSSDLTARLLAIAPRAIERRKRRTMNGPAARFSVAAAPAHKAPARVPAVALVERPKARARKVARASYLPIAAAAAALLLVTLGGAIGWWLSLAARSHDPRPPIAKERLPAPARDHNSGDEDSRPLVNRIVIPPPRIPRPDPSQSDFAPLPQSIPQITRSDLPPSPIRQYAVPAPAAAAPPVATIKSAIGAVLVDAGQRGRLRVGQGAYSLAEPLRLVSLAESWSSVEIPDVGKLVLAGPAEARLASWGDGVLEIELVYGKLGIERLPAGRHIRFQTGSAQWLARGASNYSSLAVFHDPESPSLFVPMGSVAVENVEVSARQVVRFAAGTPQPPQPIAAIRPAAESDAFAEGWLAPPDDERQKKWQAQYGKLIDRLAIVDDAGVELPLLFASIRDTRQAGLLAEWNLAAVDDASRPEQLWNLLGDHRELVRTAGVRSLFAIRAGDPRLAHFVRYVRMELGEDAGTRMAQWMRGKEQPGQIAAREAVELAEFLLHRDLAMRQLAVSLLERHATPALARARRAPPAFDAADPAGKRAEAQRQWRQLIRQIFAAQRTAPAALGVKPAIDATNVQQP